MAATITDLFTKASSGTRAEATTLTAQKAVAATSISVAALTGWPTDTAVHFQIYRVDTSNNIVPGSQLDLKGIASGTTISQIQYKAGTDGIYPIGSIVVALPTAAWDNDLVNGLTVSHNQDGTLKNNVITSAAQISDGIITANELSLGPAVSAVDTYESTTSTSNTDLATVGPAVTITVGSNGLALLHFWCTGYQNTTGAFDRATIGVSGANTIAAGSMNRLIAQHKFGSDGETPIGRSLLLTGLTPGSTTFTMKYSVSTGSGTFGDRVISVIPL